MQVKHSLQNVFAWNTFNYFKLCIYVITTDNYKIIQLIS